MELSDLLIRSRPLTVSYAGQLFNFSYDPGAYDQSVQAKANQLQKLSDDDPKKLDFITTILLAVVREWDITQNGEPLAVSAELVGQLHFVLKAIMVGAVMSDMTAGVKDPKAQPTSSPSTSLPGANGAAVLTGTPSSEQPIALTASPGF